MYLDPAYCRTLWKQESLNRCQANWIRELGHYVEMRLLILSTIVIRYSILLRDLKTDTTHPPHSCPIFVPFKPPRPEMPTLATSAARRAGVQLWEIDLLEGVLADSNALQDSSAQKERTAKVKDWEPFLTPHSKPLVLKLSFE